MQTGLFVGLTTLDLVQRVVRLPGPDEKIVAEDADLAVGGPAANAAITFAALGGSAKLVTALGRGPTGSVAAEDLARHMVTVVDAATDDHPGPAISAVSVIDGTGQRSVVSRNAEQATVNVPADLPDLVENADVVLLDGHLPDLARAAAEAARRAGVTAILDGGSWKPAIADLLGYVDAAVCSADFTVPGRVDSQLSALALIEAGVPFVATTDGPRPIRWWAGGTTGIVDVPSIRVKDTLGAGDALHGAFAFATAAGADPVPALRFAVNVAAVRVEHPGPRAWLSDDRLTGLARRAAQ